MSTLVEKSLLKYSLFKQNALYKKISNERIAKELNLMFSGNKPQCAVNLLYQFDILDAVLKIESLGIPEIKPELVPLCLVSCVNISIVAGLLLENNKIHDMIALVKHEDNDIKEFKRALFMALITIPLRQFKIKVKNDYNYAPKLIFKNSLKLKNEDIKEIEILCRYLDEFYLLIDKNKFTRLESGLFLRKLGNQYTIKICVIAICEEYIKSCFSNSIYEEIDSNILANIYNKYNNWLEFITKENLLYSDGIKPILNGVDIQQIFNIKPGKQLAKYLDKLIEIQIEYPSISKEDAIHKLKQI